MGFRLFGISIAFTIILAGCTDIRWYVAGPFAKNAHEVFIKDSTGETCLYIDGENWYTLIDLKGFEDVVMPMEGPFSPNQFFIRKDKEDCYIRIYTQKLATADNEEDCRDHFNYDLSRDYELIDIGGKTVTVVETELPLGIKEKRTAYFCTYYGGYCLVFCIKMNERIDEDKIGRILGSITFVDDDTIRNRNKDIFYVYDKKLQLAVPKDWRYEFQKDIKQSSIILEPLNGNGFKILMSPLNRFDGPSKLSVIRKTTVEIMSRWNERSEIRPALQEMASDDVTLYYFDAVDSTHDPDAPGDYPMVRQGLASINGSALYFTILFSEDGKDEALLGFDAIANARVMDLSDVPNIRFDE